MSLEKACQIVVTFIASGHAACISSLSMDFQYLFYILIVFTINLLFLSPSETARYKFYFGLIAASDLLMQAGSFRPLLPLKLFMCGSLMRYQEKSFLVRARLWYNFLDSTSVQDILNTS